MGRGPFVGGVAVAGGWGDRAAWAEGGLEGAGDEGAGDEGAWTPDDGCCAGKLGVFGTPGLV